VEFATEFGSKLSLIGTVDTIKEPGFAVVDNPKVFFSRAVILKREK